MRAFTVSTALLLSAVTVGGAQHPSTLPASVDTHGANVLVSARIVVLERHEIERAGITYVILHGGAVQLASARAPGRAGVSAEARTLGVRAFLDFARERRAVSSESVQQIVVRSGGSGRIAALDLSVGRYAARSQGPSLTAEPTLQPDGRIHLRVSALYEDVVADAWSGRVMDGSPAAVSSELVIEAGAETIVASSSATVGERTHGVLHIGRSETGRDVLVVVTASPAEPR